MSIHSGHRQRVKEEFLSGGLESFPDHRALELLLFYAQPRADVNPLAHSLLNTFGSLSGVMDAAPEELMKVEGMGEHAAILIKLIPALAAKYLASRTSSANIIRDSRDLYDLFASYFFGARNEMTYLACLDSKLKVLGVRKLDEGSPDQTNMDSRQIAAAALSLNATVVVLAHNHVSGVALPSDADISSTRYLYQTLKGVGITLYDHVILADDDMMSMRDSNCFAAF